jgi:hypothetical protein
MKRYEMKKVSCLKKMLVEETCDWCGKVINREGVQSMFTVDEFEFRYRTGESYPEGGSGEEYTIDLCLACRPKFLQTLIAQGIRVQRDQWNT